MEDNSPKDEFKISEDRLREYLRSSQKDPDYEISSEKSPRSSSNPIRDELIEMIEKVHQSVSKLDKGIDSRTEKCIDLLEKLSDAYVKQTNILAEQDRALEKLQRIVKNHKKTIVTLMVLTLLSICFSLTILATIVMKHH